MKKQLVIGLLPVLMALSACGGAGPRDNGPELFQEDTLAHEEIFGQIDSGLSQKATRNLDPLDPGTMTPVIGVQAYTGVSGYVSLRFVAAVSLANPAAATASWSRAMFKDNGDSFKEAANKPCVKAYTSIKDNGVELTAAAFDAAHGNTGYFTHFVVYSMLNIPETYETVDIRGYYLTATLTLSGLSDKYTVATDVNRTKQVSFNAAEKEHLLRGTINTFAGTSQSEDDYSSEALPLGKTARFTTTLKADDSFYVVYNHVDANPANSKFRIYDTYNVTSNNLFESSGNKIKPKANGNYVLYLDSSNNVEIESQFKLTYKNRSNADVEVPLTCAGWSNSDLQYKAVISPKTESTLTFKEGETTKAVTNKEGGNLTADYKILAGGENIDLYFKDYNGYGYGLWCQYPECSVLLNDSPYEAERREDKEGYVEIFDIDLTAGQRVVVYCGDKRLTLGDGPAYEFTAANTAHHAFYVDTDCKVNAYELATITFTNVNYDAGLGYSLFVVGSFFNNDYTPVVKYRLNNVGSNNWSRSFELPVGSKFKLCVAYTDTPVKAEAKAWESVDRDITTGGRTITYWNQA